jgi:hypothetical protein
MIGNWRLLLAIPAIAGLAIMGATGASAAPVHQAAHARAMTATSGGADPLEFVNGNGLWITGSAHGQDLKGTTSAADAQAYHYYPQSGAGVGYDALAPSNGLCWNTIALAGDAIGIDSCPANDTNEWFAIPPSGTRGYIYTYNNQDLCVTGEGDGNALKLENCGAYTNRQYWTTVNVSS